MNIEETIVAWLNDAPTLDCPASMSVPADRPKCFCTVERTGGGYESVRARPTLAIQVWDQTRWQASQTATRVRERLETLIELDLIADVDVLSVTHLPDPGPPVAERYQIAIQVTAAR